MPEKTAAGVALVQMLTDVHQLRVLVDMITLTTAVCVVRPAGTTELPPRTVPLRRVVVAPATHVAIVATPQRLQSLPPNRPLVRAASRPARYNYDPDDYEPDDSDSLDAGPEAPPLRPPIRLDAEDSIP